MAARTAKNTPAETTTVEATTLPRWEVIQPANEVHVAGCADVTRDLKAGHTKSQGEAVSVIEFEAADPAAWVLEDLHDAGIETATANDVHIAPCAAQATGDVPVDHRLINRVAAQNAKPAKPAKSAPKAKATKVELGTDPCWLADCDATRQRAKLLCPTHEQEFRAKSKWTTMSDFRTFWGDGAPVAKAKAAPAPKAKTPRVPKVEGGTEVKAVKARGAKVQPHVGDTAHVNHAPTPERTAHPRVKAAPQVTAQLVAVAN